MTVKSDWRASTLAMQVDGDTDHLSDIAPSLRPAVTFRSGNEEKLIYSRDDAPTRRKTEAVIGALEGGHAVCYCSGQAAAAAVLRLFDSDRVHFQGAYFGTRQIMEALGYTGDRLVGAGSAPRARDLLWIETPANPIPQVTDIAAAVAAAHKVGAHVVVDSTLATPFLQRPLALGADAVVHSATKFLGGHFDLLGGSCGSAR